ncbi:hypothetical protein [Streptomyces roseolus]|uniref:hypothetical protein n=1 Tax=Streptomyces roseolus TaxID=67358 RepID=UPI001673BC68|nr:hypothetical protein [Streptomyces roseolus]GGR52550.1 hypothetical protein GCM10010282_51830 [Streptomyces roseolus]
MTVVGRSTADEFTGPRDGTGGVSAVALPHDVITGAAPVPGSSRAWVPTGWTGAHRAGAQPGGAVAFPR